MPQRKLRTWHSFHRTRHRRPLSERRHSTSLPHPTIPENIRERMVSRSAMESCHCGTNRVTPKGPASYVMTINRSWAKGLTSQHKPWTSTAFPEPPHAPHASTIPAGQHSPCTSTSDPGLQHSPFGDTTPDSQQPSLLAAPLQDGFTSHALPRHPLLHWQPLWVQVP